MLLYSASVVTQLGLGHWTNIIVLVDRGGRMVGRQDRRHRTDDGTDCFVQGLLLRSADDLLKGWAGFGVGEVLGRCSRDAGMLG